MVLQRCLAEDSTISSGEIAVVVSSASLKHFPFFHGILFCKYGLHHAYLSARLLLNVQAESELSCLASLVSEQCVEFMRFKAFANETSKDE